MKFLKRFYAYLRHKILWIFSPAYRAALLIYGIKPNAEDYATLTISSYSPTEAKE